jgi:hypothetical protein
MGAGPLVPLGVVVRRSRPTPVRTFATNPSQTYSHAPISYYIAINVYRYFAGRDAVVRACEEWDRLMVEPETPLEMARRYVAEGEERCTQLIALLEAMEAQNPPQATEPVQRLLAVLDRTLAIMREHVRQEEELRRQSAVRS